MLEDTLSIINRLGLYRLLINVAVIALSIRLMREMAALRCEVCGHLMSNLPCSHAPGMVYDRIYVCPNCGAQAVDTRGL
jgi:uncharacterized protein with PIN domain